MRPGSDGGKREAKLRELLSSATMIPSDIPPAQRRIREQFAAMGAVSPATARPGKELPPVDSEAFDILLGEGVIREGAPGTYYLYEPQPTPSTRKRQMRSILAWITLILLPVAVINFCAGSP